MPDNENDLSLAIASAIAKYVEDYPEFEECREDGHRMRRMHRGWFLKMDGSAQIWERTYKCPGCGTKRFDGYSGVTRTLMRRRYKYPEGYLLAVGERFSRSDLRRWAFDEFLMAEGDVSPGNRRKRARR